MRRQHELEKGIICEKCLRIATKKDYKRIAIIEPIATSTTGMSKTVYRINLCNQCYYEYSKLVDEFFNRK